MENLGLFPLPEEEAWLLPERRRATAREALLAWEKGDLSPILQGFQVYLDRVEGKARATVGLHLEQMARFLRFLQGLGRGPLRYERGDYLRFTAELRAEGYSDGALVRHFYGAQAFLRFLEWAGLSPPPLDLERPAAILRQARPYTPEELRGLLKEAEELPSRWRYTYRALLVLIGETGLRLKQAMRLTTEDLEAQGERFRVALPGGKVDLSPSGSRVMGEYLAWREKVALPGERSLLLSPRGKPLTPTNLLDLRRALREHLGRELDSHALRLTGQARLAREYGTRGARKLLRRALL
jgi:Site-specific recombinase XerD